jgi:hypothetical protein
MNNSKTILTLIFLIAGTLLTTAVTVLPAAYAGGDDDGNKNKAEDDSAATIADCDDNDVERAGFGCYGLAANDVEVDIGEAMVALTELDDSTETAAQFTEEQ